MKEGKNKWKSGLARTRKSTFGRLANMLGISELTTETWEGLEALLIQADLGIKTTQTIVETLQDQSQNEGWTKSDELKTALRIELISRLDQPPALNFQTEDPTIILIVGVNGSGKTTSIAKLGNRFQINGKQVLLVAADTFRAAAIEQLQAWGERLGARVIAGKPEGDPGAVAYDAVQSAIARKDDIVLIDTAGRLHTRFNLMGELKKVYNVVNKIMNDAPHEVWIVMDATTGQNAIHQARAFKDAVYVSGVILAKLDTSARGGMAFAIQAELGLPILFAGLGERLDDLEPFDPRSFVDNILLDFN
ncbi:MAG: signal recognition particle-docking protein FtsY [Chloroflexi bacterium]|nr:signal recognition particle-docking protein FtsY [Chloroflexota bacterium]